MRLTAKRITRTLLELSTIKRKPVDAVRLASSCGTSTDVLLDYTMRYCRGIKYDADCDTFTF